jgi:septal ring factor EnvC (AmiA/AmiB activator)
MRERRLSLKEAIASLDDEAASWRIRAEDALLSHTRRETARSMLKQIESDIETSKARQDAAQKSVRERQTDLTEVFMSVCRYFKGEQVDAELKFTRDEINARIGSGGGAYNALSSLSFDLAALLARLNGIGEHPGFLIHDSPRESDMEVSLYRPVFQLAKQLEDKAPDSFQYIITTTEAPPADLAKPPHLCLQLDGNGPEGKLFKEDL